MKTCSRCYRYQPLDAFRRDPRYRLGVTGWCKACRSEYYRDYEHFNKKHHPIRRTEKSCLHCHVIKAATEFSKMSGKKDGLSSYCKPCRLIREQPRRMTSDGPKRNHLWTKYKMRPEDVQRLLDTQHGRCAMCQHELHRFCIDHDHATKIVRGLLCFRCNNALGYIENETLFTLAKKYLSTRQPLPFTAAAWSDRASERTQTKQAAIRRA